MTFTDDDMKRLKGLLEKRTLGEWTWEGYETPTAPPPTLYAGRGVFTHGYNLLGRLEPDNNGRNNLDAICALINLVPALLARLEAAEAFIARLQNDDDLSDDDLDEDNRMYNVWRKAKGADA